VYGCGRCGRTFSTQHGLAGHTGHHHEPLEGYDHWTGRAVRIVEANGRLPSVMCGIGEHGSCSTAWCRCGCHELKGEADAVTFAT
jgi:hypothetical protein